MKFKKLHDGAIQPKRATDGSAGYDLYTIEQFFLAPGEIRLVPTGIALEMDPGVHALVLPRSGMALNDGITVLNAPGLIDNDYRGEIGVILVNHSGKSSRPFFHGQKIAQIVFTSFLNPEWVEVDDLSYTGRGDGGFGSTDLP